VANRKALRGGAMDRIKKVRPVNVYGKLASRRVVK